MTMLFVGPQAKPAPCHTMPKIMASTANTGRSVFGQQSANVLPTFNKLEECIAMDSELDGFLVGSFGVVTVPVRMLDPCLAPV